MDTLTDDNKWRMFYQLQGLLPTNARPVDGNRWGDCVTTYHAKSKTKVLVWYDKEIPNSRPTSRITMPVEIEHINGRWRIKGFFMRAYLWVRRTMWGMV